MELRFNNARVSISESQYENCLKKKRKKKNSDLYSACQEKVRGINFVTIVVRDLEPDLAARLIPAWYEAISWQSWNLYCFYRACKKYRAISDTEVV